MLAYVYSFIMSPTCDNNNKLEYK